LARARAAPNVGRMPPAGFTPPFALGYRDPSGPFAIEATVTAWLDHPVESGQADLVTLILGPGTLHDDDRGAFPIEGLELTLRVADGRVEPMAVRNPSGLSEFQQDGLLDAVASALNAGGGPFSPTSRSDS
jgi:hypothetical protein